MSEVQVSLILLAPLLLGFIASQALRLPLKALTGVYVLLAVGNVILTYFLTGTWVAPVVIALVGLVVTVIATGFFFEKLTPSDFALIMAGVGLFPWVQWDFLLGIAYAVVLGILVVIVALRPKFKNPLKRRY